MGGSLMRSFMRSRYLSVFCLVLLLFLVASCSSKNGQSEPDVSVYESQLYASLSNSFNYYYSMDLWDFSEITEMLSRLNSSPAKERQYVIGRIDSVLAYNEYYLAEVRSGQIQLKTKVFPEDLMLQLGALNQAKHDYLTLLSSALAGSTKVLGSEFLSNNAILSDRLKELNITVIGLNEEGQKQYIQQLEETIALISDLSKALG